MRPARPGIALRNPSLSAFALCLLVLLLRSSDRLAHAHLWAEDGWLFLSAALERGTGPVLEPYAGYLHVVPRLVAALLVLLPLAWFAPLVGLLSLVAYAAAAALFARRAHRNLVRSDVTRVAAAVALCFAPGTWEVAGNLANLHSVAFLAASLVALQDPERSLGLAELVLLIVVGSMAGELVLLAPLFVGRVALRLRARAPARALVPEGAALAVVLGWAALNLLAFRDAAPALPPSPPPRLAAVSQSTVSTATSRFLLHPVLGDALTRSYFRRPAVVQAAVALGLLVVLVLGLRHLAARERALLLGACACGFGLAVLTWSVRPWSLSEAPFGPVRSLDVYRSRYWFYGAPLGLLLWVTALAALRPRAATLLCLASILLAAPRWRLAPFGPERDWAATARRIEQVRETPGASARVPINPEGWAIDVRSR